jgi:dimethylaniline monooxygenase (N-oxide forming)
MMKGLVGDIDPSWRLLPPPPVNLAPRACNPALLEPLRNKKLTSMHGVKRFTGPRSIEFEDGAVVDDIDAVICATGYSAEFEVTPFLERSRPSGFHGPELMRLWMNIFPPKYATSMALLCHSALGKSNGFSFSDVTSMAVSNVFRGVHHVPSVEAMQKKIDEDQAWTAYRWNIDHGFDTSAVKQREYQAFLHDAAGTGMENLGWGWKGWKFFFKDPKLSYLMNNGVETAHAFRYFETGKRRTWSGARGAIIHINELVKTEFPVKEDLKKFS